ncbi:MAG: DUF3488 and transglutaminase-like domain-containing protein, partial [Pseudomonadota bacterium]|nr:DUF3488 and transglutaminase-like domain-containing protein [Pseudomonadota bacterium]
ALKPLETRSLRDARSLISFALFAPFASFLLDQGPLSLLLGLATALAALASLQRLADVDAGLTSASPLAALGSVGKLAAIGLPLTLAAFWLFPRVPSPMWGIPDRAKASIGLSDSMSPGDWLDLLVDDSPALRVRFQGAPPATSQMYWRGPVLWDFDGRTWSGSAPANTAPPSAIDFNTRARWDYQIEVEPSERLYLTALDLPMNTPDGSQRSPDGNLVANIKLQSLTRWQLQSAPAVRFQPVLSEAEKRRALAYPRQSNPRSQQLARRWQDETGGDASAIVDKAMALINAEMAYSLDAPMLGRHTVDEFLFQTRTGYCEHFSSAFVFLMRSAGVPARVVTGYAGGYRNPIGDYWVVRNSDAHAWAEVWLAGRGWTRIDPTAAVAPERIFETVGDRLPGNFAGGSVNFNTLWNLTDFIRTGWNDFVLGFNAERQSRMFQKLGLERVSANQLIALLALCAALALGFMLWWLGRGERERDPLLRAWHALSKRYRRHDLAREPHETAEAWAERIAAARPDEAAAIHAASQAFQRLRYADHASKPELTRELQQRIRRLPTR